MPPRSPELRLSVQVAEGSPPCPVARARLRRWVLAALQRDAQLTIRFVGSREARALNREYRGRDHATNVLTFDYAPGVADVVICVPVLEREARAQHKRLDHHLAHLVIHGVLHAQGFEHEDDVEADAMEALEAALLRRFRIADPYAVPQRARRPRAARACLARTPSSVMLIRTWTAR